MISDEKLIQALSDYENDTLSHLESRPEYVFSPEFEKKIGRISRRKKPVSRRMTSLAASFAAICILSGALTFCVSPTARAAMLSWVRGTENSYFTYRSTGGSQENADLVYGLDAVPEGYTLFADHSQPGQGMVVYVNEEGQMLSFQYTADTGDSALYLDPEGAEHVAVTVGNVTADLYVSDSPEESSAILWVDGETDYLMSIMGFFTQEELVTLAESVAIVKAG